MHQQSDTETLDSDVRPQVTVPAPRTAGLRERRGVAPSVVKEVADLSARGLDVELVEPTPRFVLPADRQRAVDLALAEQVSRPDFVEWLFDAETHPSGRAWWGVAKRAVAKRAVKKRAVKRAVGKRALKKRAVKRAVGKRALKKRAVKRAVAKRALKKRALKKALVKRAVRRAILARAVQQAMGEE